VDQVKAWVAGHRKLIVAAVGAALTLAISVWGTDNHWVSLAILAATSLGVYGAPNTPAPGPSDAHPAHKAANGGGLTARCRSAAPRAGSAASPGTLRRGQDPRYQRAFPFGVPAPAETVTVRPHKAPPCLRYVTTVPARLLMRTPGRAGPPRVNVARPL
jgi:hypothetical protein